MTRPTSRKRPDAEGYAVGAREWLEASPQGEGRMAAAFDTRFGKPRWLTGSAALRMARRLRESGYRLAAPARELLRPPHRGPLREGRKTGPDLGSGARPAGNGMKPQDYSRRIRFRPPAA